MSTLNAIVAICEEFTETMLVDHKKNSVIVNVKNRWFATLNHRLLCLHCTLVHKSSINNGYTCTYLYIEK